MKKILLTLNALSVLALQPLWAIQIPKKITFNHAAALTAILAAFCLVGAFVSIRGIRGIYQRGRGN